MQLDHMISKMRVFREAVGEMSYQKIKMSYFIPNTHSCSEPAYIDMGYYRRHNGEYCMCYHNKQEADFRLLECSNCHKQFYLMNSGVDGWDIIPKQKTKVKIFE